MAFEPGSELERADKLRMVRIAPDKEGDGRVGGATGEKRAGSVAVRAALGGAGVGGAGGEKGLLAEQAWEEAQFGLVIMLFGIETKRVLG